MVGYPASAVDCHTLAGWRVSPADLNGRHDHTLHSHRPWVPVTHPPVNPGLIMIEGALC